jgi:hypothetical protein
MMAGSLINFNYIKSSLIKDMGAAIASEGFEFKKKPCAFVKHIPEGSASLYLIQRHYPNSAFFRILWAVRINRMADIYNLVAEKDPEYFSDTQVFSNGMGVLIDYIDNGNRKANAADKEYMIEQDEDVPALVAEMVSDIRRYVLPYFEQNNTLERANELLNRIPEERSVHSFGYPTQMMMGLIAARLTQNTDYDYLVSTYDTKMKVVAEDARREYEKLKVVLAKM